MSYRLISWGANSHGQLGQGIHSEECLLPQEVDLSRCSLEPRRIRKIVGGAGHSLILDDYGNVYSCGWNNKGQAGFSTQQDVLSFRKLGNKLEGKVVVDIACGWDCSAALTIEGTLFLWGSNCFGQLGEHLSNLRWTHEPFELLIDRKVKGISFGLRHTALITEDHKVLVAGAGNRGQLGLSRSRNEPLLNAAYTFTEVPTLTNVHSVNCGQRHTIVVEENGDLYGFGDNKHGQLGLNTDILSNTSFPIKLLDVPFKSPAEIQCGWSHTVALSDGQIFSWGRNTYGQLGVKEFEGSSTWKVMWRENESKIRQISVGSEHNVALTENDRIVCWGWNEHGNCGNGHTRDVKFPGELSLPFDYAGICIGSGAGHSFAVIKKL
ncbi:secretion-regulating guanine nucleotide exchange factor-like isoform X1 [Osmia bicornis bicornis]|uniref:secretion-regulating guanine nucleotide exchange factor-like isoform X1 n=1 Tax=Osmia bicornis bicornis TaxID=1437191 RepID=UPI001EAEACCB|nr:secretion-regulating guanine nucleotide exchange factor-like isoform X1 [Osmia bicornis bicornis]